MLSNDFEFVWNWYMSYVISTDHIILRGKLQNRNKHTVDFWRNRQLGFFSFGLRQRQKELQLFPPRQPGLNDIKR